MVIQWQSFLSSGSNYLSPSQSSAEQKSHLSSNAVRWYHHQLVCFGKFYQSARFVVRKEELCVL